MIEAFFKFIIVCRIDDNVDMVVKNYDVITLNKTEEIRLIDIVNVLIE